MVKNKTRFLCVLESFAKRCSSMFNGSECDKRPKERSHFGPWLSKLPYMNNVQLLITSTVLPNFSQEAALLIPHLLANFWITAVICAAEMGPYLLLFGNAFCSEGRDLNRREGLIIVDSTRNNNKTKYTIFKNNWNLQKEEKKFTFMQFIDPSRWGVLTFLQAPMHALDSSGKDSCQVWNWAKLYYWRQKNLKTNI